MRLTQYSVVLLAILTYLGCSDKVDHGRDSLEGVWTVNRIIEIENEVKEFGTAQLSQTEVESPQGSFTFSEDSVDYSYTLTSGVQSSVEDYSLSVERENAGFTKVDVFT